MKAKLYRECALCETKFQVSTYKIEYRDGRELERYNGQKYCSPKCGARSNYVNHREYYQNYWLTRSNLWKWKKELNCLMCEKEFIPNVVQQKYCQEPCNPKRIWKKNNKDKINAWQRQWFKKKAREDWHEKECKRCEKIFLPKLGNKNQQIYCSAKCSQKGQHKKAIESGKKKIYRKTYREKNREKINQNLKEYTERISFGIDEESKSGNRTLTLERDNHTCQRCKEIKRSRLVVHHNTYPATVEHLITLCRSCHAWIHANKNGKYYGTGSESPSVI